MYLFLGRDTLSYINKACIYSVLLFSDLDIARHSAGFIFLMLMVRSLRCSFSCKVLVLLQQDVEMLLLGGGHEIRPVEKVLPSLEVCSMFLAIYS